MFSWCYYAHIMRIAGSSPLGPVGLEGEGTSEEENLAAGSCLAE